MVMGAPGGPEQGQGPLWLPQGGVSYVEGSTVGWTGWTGPRILE